MPLPWGSPKASHLAAWAPDKFETRGWLGRLAWLSWYSLVSQQSRVAMELREADNGRGGHACLTPGEQTFILVLAAGQGQLESLGRAKATFTMKSPGGGGEDRKSPLSTKDKH